MREEIIGDYVIRIPKNNERFCPDCHKLIFDITKLPIYYPPDIKYPGQKSFPYTLYKCPHCNNLVAFGAGGVLVRKHWKVRKEDNNFIWFREVG